MSCNTCVRKKINFDCKPQADIKSVQYACPEDLLSIVYQPDSNNLVTKGSISGMTVDTGTDPSYGFHDIKAVLSGDNKMTLTWSREKGDDGTETKLQEFTLRIETDTPDIRAILTSLFANPQHLLIEYNGEDFPFELIQNCELVDIKAASTNVGRAHDLIFRKSDSDRGILIWDTDYATTVTLIDSLAAA